jgi:hypothetical protein
LLRMRYGNGTRRKAALRNASCVFVCILLLLFPRRSNARPAPPTAKMDIYSAATTLHFREGRNRWVVRYENGSDYERVRFFCNRRLVRTVNRLFQSAFGTFTKKTTAALKFRFPIVFVAQGGFSAVGTWRRYYCLRHGKVKLMLEMGEWNGGPIFRDYDGDGKPEWVIDDYDFNGSQNDWGDHLYLYKLQPNYTLRLWKTVPNRSRRHLTDPSGRVQ